MSHRQALAQLTGQRVADARRQLADADRADITNPDMPQTEAVRLIVRLTETLRTLTDHAERTGESAGRLFDEIDGLRAEVDRLNCLHDDNKIPTTT